MIFDNEIYALRLCSIFLVVMLMGMQSDRPNSEIEQRMAIAEVISEYAHRWDGKDASAFVALFTEDVVIERWVDGERKSRLVGREALLDYAEESFTGRLADRQTRHHISGLVFKRLAANSAETENIVLITHQLIGEPVSSVVATGVYRMSWRFTDSGWEIEKRVLLSDKP